MWFQIDWRKHPDAHSKSLPEVEEEVWQACVERGVLIARGSWFYAQRDIKHEDMFLRATFAAAKFDKMTEGIRRFGEALMESFHLQ